MALPNSTNVEVKHRIEVLVPGESLDMPQAQDYFFENGQAVRYRDALHVDLHNGEVWLFEYGVLVFWGAGENDKQRLLNILQDYIVQPYDKSNVEEYTYELDDGPLKIHMDKLTFSGELMQRLAVSHAFAQSIKLGVLEGKALDVISTNANLARELAKTGQISLSRKDLSKLRGTLFAARSDIILNFNLLDTPEFFWDYPELEPSYLTVAKYLDLQPRIEILNRKLETIHELVDMLASEQNHKHSSFLEWIIIALIAVEIVLYFPGSH